MKTIRTIAIGAFALASLLPAYAQVADYRDLKFPPLHQMKVEHPRRVQLANGMVLFLMEDHELPLIRATAVVRGGERDVPPEKAGLTGIYNQAWRTGGTEKQTGDQLDDFLEARAARVETSGDDDSSSVTLNILKDDFDTVFPIFLDVLQHPAFRQEKIDLAKTAASTSISRRNDDPHGIAAREAEKLVYGVNSPFTRQAEYATINSITRDDLLAFHKKYVHPNNMIFGIVGDFDSASMEKKLRAAFEKLPKGPQAPKTAPPVGMAAKPGVYSIKKDDVNQTNIYLVHAGIRRDNPDIYALAILDEILGAPLTGRLFGEVRTKRGLAYSAGGGVGWQWDFPGMFSVSLSTKSGSTVEALGATRSVLTELDTKPVTAEELEQARQTVLNSFIFTRDSKAKTLTQQMNLEFYGYPADWYDRYVPAIQKITTADIARVAKQYIKPDQAAILVVGNEKEYDKPLSTLGTVTPIDITIPEPGAKPTGAKAAASTPEGLALVKKVQDFVGGKAKLETIKATRTLGTMNMKTPAGAMSMDADVLVVYPDHQRTVMKMPMGEMTMVTTPEAGFVIAPMGTQDLPGSRRDEMLKDLRRDMTVLLRDADKPGHTFALGGTEKIGDVNAQILDITVDGSALKWWVDPATGRVLRSARTTSEGEIVSDYLEWKEFGGLKFATKAVRHRNGEEIGSGEMKSVEVNPAVDMKVFEKPVAK